ncbi:MAG TPA: hypothetical protein VL358_04515 [Caulobacteraceae bacterium]|jgi:hypothetical protein|nr:hypothetical protein [Caulobacteraceae bacterium]
MRKTNGVRDPAPDPRAMSAFVLVAGIWAAAMAMCGAWVWVLNSF